MNQSRLMKPQNNHNQSYRSHKKLLPMMDPNAPAPKPRMIKQVEIPATNRQLLNNVRILL